MECFAARLLLINVLHEQILCTLAHLRILYQPCQLDLTYFEEIVLYIS